MRSRRAAARLVAALAPLLLLSTVLATSTPAEAAPATRVFGVAIEGFAPYVGQSTCSPTAKPGTVALRSLLLNAYKGTGDSGIVRNCGIGGRSEHKEGRAWDWRVSVTSATQRAQAANFLSWALATDKYGHKAAMARRLGIMYIIWNRRIWSASRNSWRTYTGADPHTSHVHISLSWAGAMKRTSYWTGKVVTTTTAPKPTTTVAPKPVTTTTPKPTASPTPKPTASPTPTLPPVLVAPASLTVPATTKAGVRTPFRLVAGKRYLLLASGTYQYGPEGMTADAECSQWPDGRWQRRSVWEADGSWTGPEGHLDVQVAGQDTRWSTRDGSRCDTTSHTYWTVFVPSTTGTLWLRVLDDYYDDNTGSVAVRVTPLDG